MILVNFGHPLTAAQLSQVEGLVGRPLQRTLDVKVHFDPDRSFVEQMPALVEGVGLSGAEWQTAPLLLNLPSFSPIAVLLLAELHGRMGYFPTVLRIRPMPGSAPPQFEVVELLPLQALRDGARSRR